MVRALTGREQAEFDRLGVTVAGSPCACDGAEDCGCAESELPEREVSTTLDWSLARKFNDFWPSTMEGPHDFPWLGDLVTRERAWRWASQFPQFFATVEAADRDAIRAFIARTLTEVEPPSDLEAAKGKGCCKSKKSEPAPSCCADKRQKAEQDCRDRGKYLVQSTFECKPGAIGGNQEGGCDANTDYQCSDEPYNPDTGRHVLVPGGDEGPDWDFS